jgi:toxin ParE1/3/4
MRVVLLDAARADIGDIDRYITDDSPGAARRVVLGLIERMEGLADAPHVGRPGRWPNTRELVVPPYVIPYRVRGQTIEILRVVHSAREWPDRPSA